MKGTLNCEDLRAILRHTAVSIEAQKDYLSELDGAVGDGDHGVSMARGFRAVSEKLAGLPETDCGALLSLVGTTLVSVIGGATGPIFGTWFLKGGQVVKGKGELTLADCATAFEAGLAGVQALGKAEVGDKTMVDALHPAVAALKEAAARAERGEVVSLADAFAAAARAARAGAGSTIPLIAKKGRTRYAGENAVGHQDAGATSVAVILEAWAAALSGSSTSPE